MWIVFITYVVVSAVKYCFMHKAHVMCEQNKMWQDYVGITEKTALSWKICLSHCIFSVDDMEYLFI